VLVESILLRASICLIDVRHVPNCKACVPVEPSEAFTRVGCLISTGSGRNGCQERWYEVKKWITPPSRRHHLWKAEVTFEFHTVSACIPLSPSQDWCLIRNSLSWPRKTKEDSCSLVSAGLDYQSLHLLTKPRLSSLSIFHLSFAAAIHPPAIHHVWLRS